MPQHILTLGSHGIPRLKVRRKPRIAILATGKEIVEVGEPLQSGQIWNSTAPFLKTALSALGTDPTFYGIVKDDPEAFFQIMNRIFSDAPDVVITTGAVSVGKHDFIAQALSDLKAQILFSKVAIRPGKPILFAKLPQGPSFFGLPGNPVSTAVGMRFFVVPFLRKMLGQAQEKPWTALLEKSARKPEGFRCFFKARVESRRGALHVSILPGQSSFMISPLLEANAWAVLPEEAKSIQEGTPLELFPLWKESLCQAL